MNCRDLASDIPRMEDAARYFTDATVYGSAVSDKADAAMTAIIRRLEWKREGRARGWPKPRLTFVQIQTADDFIGARW